MRKAFIVLTVIFAIFLVSCSKPDVTPDNNCTYNDTSKEYVGKDLDSCSRIKFICEQGYEYFSDGCGCGCRKSGYVEQEKHFCTAEQKKAQVCTKEYVPVCGWWNYSIQCFKYPCAATYGNVCTACAEPMVDSWTSGECPK